MTTTDTRRRQIALLAAITCSAIGVAMSAIASIDRSVPGADRWVLAAANIGVTVAAHTLLAITRRPAALLVWVACVAVVVYGHVTFVAGAMTRAGQQRSQAVPQATAEQAALMQQLAGLTGRSVTDVATAMSGAQRTHAYAARTLTACTATRMPGQCATAQAAVTAAAARIDALQFELASARTADDLRRRLSDAAADTDQRRAAASADPAAAALQALTGLSADRIQSAAAILTATLIELVAVLMWQTAFPPQSRHHHDDPLSAITTSSTHHALDTTPAAARHASARPARQGDGSADAGRRVPDDHARPRPADGLHRAGSGRHDVASVSTHTARAAGPDGRPAQSTSAQARQPGDGLGRVRASAVDTG